MKAIAQDKYGLPGGVLGLQDVDERVVEGDAVLVRLHAASVSLGDWQFMRGEPQIMRLQAGLRRTPSWVATWRGASRRSART